MVSIEFLRQFRIGGYAIFDFATAFLGIYLFSLLTSKIFLKLRLDIPKRSWMLLTLPIGIATHLIIGRITPMTKNFMDTHGHYVLKILIVGLLIFGLKDIKIIKKNNPGVKS
jgi:hypothetical protein